MKLSEAIKGYVLNCQASGLSQNTININQLRLRQFCDYLDDPELELITPDQVIRFYAYMQTEYVPQRKSGDKSPLSPSSVSHVWCALRSFYNWAAAEFQMARPDQKIKNQRWNSPAIQPFSLEEIRAMIKATGRTRQASTQKRKSYDMERPTGLRDHTLILLLLDTGIRVGECGRLNVGDVDLENRTVTIAPYSSGKKTKGRQVFIGSNTARVMWRFLAQRKPEHPDEPLFLSSTGERMNNNSIRIQIKRLADKAGVHNAHPHRFRHTFAIEFLRNGGNVFVLQRLLGHSSLDMVKKYLSIVSSDLAEMHRRASPADRVR